MNERQYKQFLYLFGILVIVFFMPFLGPLRFLLGVLMAILLAGFFFFILRSTYLNKKEEKAFQNTVEGRAVNQLDRIQELAEKNYQEAKEIQQSIQALRKNLSHPEQLTPTNRIETQKLLDAYLQEKKLRDTKSAFFKASIQKLNHMVKNQQVSRELEAKKSKLLELQEEQYEELAELENIRYDIETDVFYLEAIDELSEKTLELKSLPGNSSLLAELEKMTEKLKRGE